MATCVAPVRGSETQAQETIQRGVHELLTIVGRHHLESDNQLIASLDKLRKRTASRTIRLTVLGEFSAGKTTFINSLLGTGVLKTGILPTTAACTFISYADTTTCDVVLKNGSTVTINPNDIGQFSVEGARAAEVDYVHLRLPNSLLDQGLVVVDTPGVNVNIDAHEAITAKAISESNACVYLMDARQPGKKTTIDFLRRIHGQVDKFFFVLNRADILDPEEQEEAVEFVTDALHQECGIPNPRVLLLSSISNDTWFQRFIDFKHHLHEFMCTERELVICAELARLLDVGIAVCEELLQSKCRLLERELAAHYEITLPDASDIMRALQKELEQQIAIDTNAIRSDYSRLHREVCDSLRTSVELVICSAHTTDTLVSEAPKAVSKSFEAHGSRLQQFLSERFEQMFSVRQSQVIATVNGLFSNVNWLEQQAFCSRPGPWLAMGAGAILMPMVEWIYGAGQPALWMSPVLGVSFGGTAYGIFYWAMNRSSFTPPAIPSLAHSGYAATVITSGTTYRNAANNPVQAPMAPVQIGRMAGNVAGHPAFAIGGALISAGVYGFRLLMDKLSGRLDKLRDEIRTQISPVLDDFEETSKKSGLDTVEAGRQSVLRSLTSVTGKSTDRYGLILERIVRPQRKIREALESRREAIRTDVGQLREFHREIVSAYAELLRKLKGVSAAYRSAEATIEEAESPNVVRADYEQIDPARSVKLVDSTVATRYKPKKGLAIAWATCVLSFIVLSLATLQTVGALRSTAVGRPPIAASSPPIAPVPASSDLPNSSQINTAQDHERADAVLTDYAVLGFRGGQSRSIAAGHASEAGFREVGCADQSYDFTDCHYVRESDEKLRLGFRLGVLVVAEYEAGIARYRQLRQGLISTYGAPREVPDKDGSKLSDMWGGIGDGQSLAMVERWDGTAGTLMLDYDEVRLAQTKASSSYTPAVPDSTSDRQVSSSEAPDAAHADRNASRDRGTLSSMPGSEETSVLNAVSDWADAFRNRDVRGLADCYAPVVDRYFLRNNVPREYIHTALGSAFGRMLGIHRYEVKDVRVEVLPESSGLNGLNVPSRATATFNKEWETAQSDGTIFSGEEIEKLTFTKLADGWKIVREEEMNIIRAEKRRY